MNYKTIITITMSISVTLALCILSKGLFNMGYDMGAEKICGDFAYYYVQDKETRDFLRVRSCEGEVN